MSVDLRDEDVVYAGNRFVIYALFPHCDVSLHVMWGLRGKNVTFAVGKSIIDRGSEVDVGTLCLTYEGGHAGAGTCQVGVDRAEEVKDELIGRLPRPLPEEKSGFDPLLNAA